MNGVVVAPGAYRRRRPGRDDAEVTTWCEQSGRPPGVPGGEGWRGSCSPRSVRGAARPASRSPRTAAPARPERRCSRHRSGSTACACPSRTRVRYASSWPGPSTGTATRRGRTWRVELAASLTPEERRVDVVTWAPTTTGRRRARGFDQAELLARRLAREIGRPARPAFGAARRRGPDRRGPRRPPARSGLRAAPGARSFRDALVGAARRRRRDHRCHHARRGGGAAGRGRADRHGRGRRAPALTGRLR